MSDTEDKIDEIISSVSSIPKELEPKLKEMAIAETKPQVEMKVEETEELTAELETKKPKVKRERTEKQKAVFEKARLARAANVAKRKAEKEASKKPRGRPKKPEPEPEPEPVYPSSEDETVIEEEIEYRKKPKAKPKVTKKVKKIVYVSDDSDEESSDDEEFYNQLQRKYKTPVYQPEPQQYQPPATMNNFYRFA